MTGISIVAVNRYSEIMLEKGKCWEKLTAHSIFKFFQVMPVFLLGLDDKYGLTEQELTVMMSSHLAQTEHIEILEAILKKTRIKEQDMVLSLSAPTGKISYENWKRAGLPMRKIYHPCSGKHIGMMLAHRELTGGIQGYEKQDSKLQRMIYNIVLNYAECSPQMVHLKIDNCQVPTFILPMSSMAVAYKNLVCPSQRIASDLIDISHRIRMCCHHYPIMLEGDGCLSSMLTAQKGLIAKAGIGGILAIGIEDQGCGIIIKSETGDWEPVIKVIEDYRGML